jgi:hypothetical protein
LVDLGEAEEISKGEEDPFLLSGCQLTGGTGLAIVIAVGTESRWGRIKVRQGHVAGGRRLVRHTWQVEGRSRLGAVGRGREVRQGGEG